MGASPSKGEITGTSWFLFILLNLKSWFLLYKNGPVIQMVITSVMPIVTRQKYHNPTEEIWAIQMMCLDIFYLPPAPRHPPVNLIYIMAYFKLSAENKEPGTGN